MVIKDKNLKIGFIGQGYVGKNYADNFEKRGFDIVRYSLEEPYKDNKEKIRDCNIVFIAVPTPTTKNGFDSSIVESSFASVSPGTIVVIKSTVLPGTTAKWQEKYKELVIIFSPEFLREATAADDAANPYSNIVGLSKITPEHERAGKLVMRALPSANSEIFCTSTEAEIIKYAQNVSGYIDIITFNVFYDLAKKLNADWDPILKAMRADPNIPSRFANPVHKSGRGAGGHCLIKDMAALRHMYESLNFDSLGASFLKAAEQKNIKLLSESKKDLDLLKGVYED